jgi:hypothetical protein
MLDLAPYPNVCFFRQFIDATLSSIYHSYTGHLQKLTDLKMRATFPREFTMTVFTLIHVLPTRSNVPDNCLITSVRRSNSGRQHNQ